MSKEKISNISPKENIPRDDNEDIDYSDNPERLDLRLDELQGKQGSIEPKD